jgi:hypothetical protein
MAKRAAFVVIVSSWLVAVATTVRAQSDETDVPDHVLLEAGGFAIFASTNMVFNSATLGGSTVSFEQDLNLPERAARGFVARLLAADVNWWIGRRVYARGDARYILVKPENSTQSITEARASLTWYAWQHFGIGGQFLYNKFRFDRSILSTDLGGSYRYQGVQVLVSTAF